MPDRDHGPRGHHLSRRDRLGSLLRSRADRPDGATDRRGHARDRHPHGPVPGAGHRARLPLGPHRGDHGGGPLPHRVLATEYVRGLQSAGVIATLKHFAGHAASRAGRNHAPVSIGMRELHDIDLVPFEMAVRLGEAGAVMNSYANLDGIPPAASRWLLTELLRETWGFEGTVVADYWAVSFLTSMHRVVEDDRQAAVTSLRAGMDIELPETTAFPHLADAVRDGELEAEVLP